MVSYVKVILVSLKVILCASEHICSIVRYCFRSFKQGIYLVFIRSLCIFVDIL